MHNLNENLTEVRKAYRLIYDYQKRILDLINFIRSKYDFIYLGGFSKFSNVSPRNGSGNLTFWSWDWLNLYFYEFHFHKKIINKDEIRFSIFLISDSGYFDKKKDNSIQKTNPDLFLEPEASKSKLIFVIGKNTWELFNTDNWNNTDFTTGTYGHKEDEKGIMLFKSYDLDKFIDENTAKQTLIDFQSYCINYDINLPIIERKII
ncbi:hypothetical protein [Chryseobacterium arthrosphaerae]|uniref:Uncharacterized protein n=1 Tax=Chryseobacterium arthrosphaerae TaxID=651561 RepID=A0A1B8ZV20_9FLAO|nr:hypothetical protein [Chryseobacterium arthrosphaerae]OCA75435.1 hypothetical protein BBI00_14365 [Chryseobacterium arthrosphaerae]